jgi:hypothetical protein
MPIRSGLGLGPALQSRPVTPRLSPPGARSAVGGIRAWISKSRVSSGLAPNASTGRATQRGYALPRASRPTVKRGRRTTRPSCFASAQPARADAPPRRCHWSASHAFTAGRARAAGAPACLPAAPGEVGGDQAPQVPKGRRLRPLRRPRDPRRPCPRRLALACRARSSPSIAAPDSERCQVRPGAGKEGWPARERFRCAPSSRVPVKLAQPIERRAGPRAGRSRPGRARRARRRR